MDQPQYNLPVSAHVSTTVTQPPTVEPVGEGRYAINFGICVFSLHCTPAQWRQINAAVEAGFAVQERKPVDIIGEYLRPFANGGQR